MKYGGVIHARQVSNRAEKINGFFSPLTRERLRDGESFVAVLEVSGFGDWLIDMLYHYRCQKVILIQRDDRKKQKTDRRDAAARSALLWVNRGRLLHGKPQWDYSRSRSRPRPIAPKTDREDPQQAHQRLPHRAEPLTAA